MLDNVLRIATRQSPLALWQAHYVKDKLMASHRYQFNHQARMARHQLVFD
ncbi:hypothetical protein ACUOFC_21175, partial [Escherichia sp. TWPC-MK]